MWKFTVEVMKDPNENADEIWDVEWETLEISVDDSKLGGAMDDDDVDRAFTVDAPDKSLQEQFQRLAGIRPLYEQSFDDRLKAAGGFSDEEFDDITSKDIGEPFPGTDEVSNGYKAARDLIEKLRQQYRGMSDQDLDDFSVEMIKHFLDNVEAKDYARKNLNTTTSRLNTL